MARALPFICITAVEEDTGECSTAVEQGEITLR